MRVLGFNSTHDCGAALVEDGRVVFAIEEERLSRNKHQGGFPELSIAAVCDAASIAPHELDAVAYYWDPWSGLWRFAWHFLKSMPRSLTYVRRQPGIWRSMIDLKKEWRRRYGFRGAFHFVNHHRAHAASTFFPSGFDEAAILTLDGTGEWATTFFGHGRGRTIETLGTVNYPHSLGKVYEAVTQYLGFRPMSGEGKVMGLAPYGEPRFLDDFRRIIRMNGEDSYDVDRSFFDYQHGRAQKFSDRFIAHFGPQRSGEADLEDRHRDMACSLQARIEEVGLALARRLKERTGSRNLCLAGGVAFNSVLNGRIVREAGFDNVFVTPAANDAGAGLGAALSVSIELGGAQPVPWPGTGIGPAFSEEDHLRALAAKGLIAERPQFLAQSIAKRLEEGAIVGWFAGRMEYGPRALGHRSLLADPRSAATKDHVNARVKHREGFRPFAPIVLESEASKWFENPGPSPFMLEVHPVRPEQRERCAAITHVDGTARVQTVAPDHEGGIDPLLRAFQSLTGVPMLLNTSFNVRGQPIVCRPEEAIETFLSTDIDILVLDGLVVEKRGIA